MRTILRSLLGETDFEKFCFGIKVGIIDKDILQLVVPVGIYAADIKLHHSDDFAVAAEYALARPIREVKVLSANFQCNSCNADAVKLCAEARLAGSCAILPEVAPS